MELSGIVLKNSFMEPGCLSWKTSINIQIAHSPICYINPIEVI